jgi:hypothetical protein
VPGRLLVPRALRELRHAQKEPRRGIVPGPGAGDLYGGSDHLKSLEQRTVTVGSDCGHAEPDCSACRLTIRRSGHEP